MAVRRAAIAVGIIFSTGASLAFARPAASLQSFGAVGPAWQAAWNAKLADDATGLFAENAVFSHATGEEVTGREAIASLLKAVLAANNPTIAMSPAIQVRAGRGAWVSGSYRETIVPVSGGGAKRVHGQYLLVLRQGNDGGWLIERMMWSDDQWSPLPD